MDSPLPASREARLAAAGALGPAGTGRRCCSPGRRDLVSDGERAWCVTGGSDAMSRVTGTGCMLSVLCGVFAAVEPGRGRRRGPGLRPVEGLRPVGGAPCRRTGQRQLPAPP